MATDSANESLKDEKSTSNIKNDKNREEEIREVAIKFADQHDVGAWGILTAISPLSRKRPQGINIILSADEHSIGRCAEDSCYRIESLSVSAKHCTIYRKRSPVDGEVDSNIAVSVFLKDTSMNGTYINRTKLHSAKFRLRHGDIISFIHPPHNALAYAFVYREVSKSTVHANGAVLKRKSEYFGAESKRLKGIGIGAPEGPISLDDVRSLQRSNTELRQQLESHVQTIETICSENRATIARHENELKNLKEKVSSSYLDHIKELRKVLDTKQNEIDEHNMSLAELRRSIDDLKEMLQLSNQSRADADEIIHSQRASISELEAQLLEERNLRRGEREKAEADLKYALQRAHSEAQEEIKRQAEVYLRQHNEQQEVISKLQESEKESRVLVKTLTSKLVDARENLVMSEKKVRQLEVQIGDEPAAYVNCRKKSETLDAEVRRLTKELESEKVSREEAWAKVSSLELQIASAIRDLSIEKQRFQGAREKIILSMNGTYINRTKLHSAKFRLRHGDIISFIHPPHNALAYAFVYREVSKSTGHTNGAVLKRKSEYFGAESKRLKGIGIGAPEGPISLDDGRSLQRSNTELRQQLESHVQTIETIHSENRGTIARHENELKNRKEKVSSSYLDQIKELRKVLDSKQNEIDEHNMSLAELCRSIDDLKEMLQLSNQSRADADEIIHSQRASISELEAQLLEEKNLRRGEREKAEADLKYALQRAHSEAQEEIKRQAEVYLRQHNEQQEVISKLQESEKESRVLVKTLRSKLEDARENLVMSEKKVRQLEVQIGDEQAAYVNSRKKSETLDAEVRRLTKELESEKVAREEAWAKVSSLELQIASAIRDLSVEKQRFQGAREKIILTQYPLIFSKIISIIETLSLQSDA